MKARTIRLFLAAWTCYGNVIADEVATLVVANAVKLEVTSQKLVQDAPHIYPGVLEGSKSELRMIVSVATQRIYLIKNHEVAFDTPISTALIGYRTPRGSFAIKEKIQKGKISNIYKCLMPLWMRIGATEFGMHEGELPGHPASHGCIRLPRESARFIFDHVSEGTQVEVVDSWTPRRINIPQP